MKRTFERLTLRNHALRGIALCALAGLLVSTGTGRAEESRSTARFKKEIQPILSQDRSDCHMDGMSKGKVSFDEFKSHEELLDKRELWWAAIKNLRAGLMPPEKKPRPSAEELRRLEDWIKSDIFKIDPKNPDPGRVTVRRLNRAEYRNTIRDLMGVEFKAEEEFPPDDTGYGFDNIGDVLTVSPMLLEKYLQAAEAIVTAAVPTVPKVVREVVIRGRDFKEAQAGNASGRTNAVPPAGGDGALVISYYKETKVSHPLQTDQAGTYRLVLDLTARGDFNPDPGRCRLVFNVDGREVWQQEFKWEDRKKFHFEIDQDWQPGTRELTFHLQPLTPADQRRASVDMHIVSVAVQGPLDRQHWIPPKNYDRFFFADEPPTSKSARAKYAREVLSRFATKAFRRPVDAATLDRLVTISETAYSQPGKRFEEGVARGMVAVLALPRFVFRVEEPQTSFWSFFSKQEISPVDEYSLASRLSYFLWSSMPDDELLRAAEQGTLRKNLSQQVKRMLDDPRSKALVENFTGQWLQTRDVEGISIDARSVLIREDGAPTNQGRGFGFGFRRAPPRAELTRPLREAMKRETELYFDHVLRQDRSVLELIDSDYTFLNEALAKHYGITNVTGTDLRLVKLPENSPRGGVLTHGSVLVVTSNPTRTSPVKRGLFILDNILGTPPPPPPGDVPVLEDSEKEFKDREPTLREVLEVHRDKPLCASCHARMDPLGLVLENFNAMGMWREKERSQPIDAAGKLITGEPFNGVRDVKRIITNEHRLDYYRCLTEKLLTYALGRGVEYYDVQTVDQIVERLDKEQGRFSALLSGIIESAPFQKRRNMPALAAEPKPPANQPVETKRVEAKLQP